MCKMKILVLIIGNIPTCGPTSTTETDFLAIYQLLNSLKFVGTEHHDPHLLKVEIQLLSIKGEENNFLIACLLNEVKPTVSDASSTNSFSNQQTDLLPWLHYFEI